ncbi:hypothetical protein Plano_2325 [Planococcus sp. PAMC 21323]|uniref:CatB-related O-acetyltransferase n=1 Tax=Planococcus sp. PAMC 21323 TaxID=1526927 RepID=UPI0005862C54|nr:CatB-related O-acetyltransferase [Planococcus sp. PAMC 21323]AIY06290.1 hypothetical protein Plano_2325 [Planococcus sp. PAMC 21323]
MNILYLISKIVKKIHIPAIKNSKIHKSSKICSASHIVNTNIGKYTYIGNSCTVLQARIGNFCSVADNCIIGGASHPIEWGSTSPVFHNKKNVMKKNFSNHTFITGEETVIGSDVWIGNNSLIKSGLHIGNGAIIGMGSVLTKNVGPYEIWAGNPARLIRKRFDEETISMLQKSEWWTYDNTSLKNISTKIHDIKSFTKIL